MGACGGLATDFPTCSVRGLSLHPALLSMRPAGRVPRDGQCLAPLLMGWLLLATSWLSKQACVLSKALELHFEFC